MRKHSYIFAIFDATIFILCFVFLVDAIAMTYGASYGAQQFYQSMDMVIMFMFSVEVFINWKAHDGTYVSFLTSNSTLATLVVLIPTVLWPLEYATTTDTKVKTFSPRVLRFAVVFKIKYKIMNYVKNLENLGAVTSQLVSLGLSTASYFVFLGALFTALENDIKAFFFYQCQYCNAATDWTPSCYVDRPFDPATDDCDCSEYNCFSEYWYFDQPNQPSHIHCANWSFLDGLYFVAVK